MNKLQKIIKENPEMRIIVVGTTCIGKSTMAATIPNALDMDEVLSPMLTQEEKGRICESPWTPEIGEYMGKLIREKIQVEPGKPLFTTEVLDCDLIIYLEATEQTLKERCERRGVNLEDAIAMDYAIRRQVYSANKSKLAKLSIIPISVEDLAKEDEFILTLDDPLLGRIKSICKQIAGCEECISKIFAMKAEDDQIARSHKTLIEEYERQITYLNKCLVRQLNEKFGVTSKEEG